MARWRLANDIQPSSCKTSCLPIIIFSQRHLFKVNVKSLALGSFQQPVARQVVAVVAGKAGRDDPTYCDVPHHTTAGSWESGRRSKTALDFSNSSYMTTPTLH